MFLTCRPQSLNVSHCYHKQKCSFPAQSFQTKRSFYMLARYRLAPMRCFHQRLALHILHPDRRSVRRPVRDKWLPIRKLVLLRLDSWFCLYLEWEQLTCPLLGNHGWQWKWMKMKTDETENGWRSVPKRVPGWQRQTKRQGKLPRASWPRYGCSFRQVGKVTRGLCLDTSLNLRWDRLVYTCVLYAPIAWNMLEQPRWLDQKKHKIPCKELAWGTWKSHP